MMVCAQCIGNAVTVTVANTHGNLDLNVMLPVMARNLLESLTYLTNSVTTFTEKGIRGLTANKERAESLVEWSMSMVTSLAPVIGYDAAAKLAKRAVDEGRTVRDLCVSESILPTEQLDELLDPRKMTEPGLGAGGE
jgi:fumarate hydratase class II